MITAVGRLIVILIMAGVGAALGRVVVLVIAFVHMPPLPYQLLIEGLGALLLGWTQWRNFKHAAGPARGVHGSARLAGQQEVRQSLGGAHGLIVGRERAKPWSLLRYDGPAHLVTLAPTRSGKGAGAVIPNLLTADRSALVIDPKGENARVAARARRHFGPVYVLDPFGVSGEASAAFNPLADLDPDSLDLAEDVTGLADALVQDAPGQTGEAHWNEEAKALIAGIVLHVVCSEPHAQRTLNRVRDLLTLAPARFVALLEAMSHSSGAGGLVARAANRHLGKGDREAAGVLSSAQRHTHFLDSPRMAQVMDRSDFSFAELKPGVATVFLVLPPDRLDAYARWLRLMVVQALTALARSQDSPPSPVLFLLDEFAALGRLQAVEQAFGLMAGYDLQLWAILQDIHQLRAVYGERAGTFLSNAGVVQVFNVADYDTASWVSRLIGSTDQAFTTTSTSSSQAWNQLAATKSTGTSTHLTRRDLLTPDEVMQLPLDVALLLRPGHAPASVRKVRYFADAEFQGLYDAP